MRITLNLATRPFADLGPAIKRLRIAMGVLVLLSIGLALGLRSFHHKAEETRARDHSLDGAIARIAQERQGYQDLMRQPVNAEVLGHAEALNQLFDQKAFSWTLAMEDLETVLPGGVQVSSIEPVRDKDGKITLRLRVIGPRDRTVELVQNLEHSRRFLSPSIVGENSESTGGAGEQLQPVSASNRVNFDLLAVYNPASPGERRPARAPATAAGNPENKPAQNHPAAQPVSNRMNPALRPGRPPYTGAPRPLNPRPRPNPVAGGPR